MRPAVAAALRSCVQVREHVGPPRHTEDSSRSWGKEYPSVRRCRARRPRAGTPEKTRHTRIPLRPYRGPGRRRETRFRLGILVAKYVRRDATPHRGPPLPLHPTSARTQETDPRTRPTSDDDATCPAPPLRRRSNTSRTTESILPAPHLLCRRNTWRMPSIRSRASSPCVRHRRQVTSQSALTESETPGLTRGSGGGTLSALVGVR